MQAWTERMTIIALLALAIISQAIGNILLSQGMKVIARESQLTWKNWVSIYSQALQSPSILLGVGFFVIFFVLFAVALVGCGKKPDLPADEPGAPAKIIDQLLEERPTVPATLRQYPNRSSQLG